MQNLSRVLLIVLAFVVGGCSWFSKEDKIEPDELVDIESTIKIKKQWSVDVGSQGKDELYTRLLPAIDGDRIYAASIKGTVTAYDRREGDEIWDTNIKETITSAVGAGSGVVLVGTINGDLVALSQLDGEEQWRTNLTSEMLAAAQASGSVVVAQTIDGKVMGVDLNTGKRLWGYTAAMPALTLRGSGTPALVGNIGYFGFASGKVVALDVETGLLVWQQQAAYPEGRTELERLVDFDGKPLVIGKELYVASYQGRAVAMDRMQGRAMWAEEISTAGGLAYGQGNIYLSQDDDTVTALRMASGRSAWENDQMSYRQLSTPAVVDDYVAVADFEGYVHFLNAEDGTFAGRYDVGAGVRNDLQSDGNILYVLSNSGRLVALTVEKK